MKCLNLISVTRNGNLKGGIHKRWFLKIHRIFTTTLSFNQPASRKKKRMKLKSSKGIIQHFSRFRINDFGIKRFFFHFSLSSCIKEVLFNRIEKKWDSTSRARGTGGNACSYTKCPKFRYDSVIFKTEIRRNKHDTRSTVSE